MSWKAYDFECDACGAIFEEIVNDDARKKLCRCGGGWAHRLFPTPTVQTVETHMRGTNMVDSFGGYHDYNLRDLKTGEVPYITSVAQKNRILRERGFVEVGPTDHSRDQERSRRGRIYS